MNDKTPNPVASAKQRVRRFRIAGIVVLAVGVVAAVIVYWLGTSAADLSDDPAMAGYDKPEERQMGILYGKQGELIEDWSNDLKQPGTQAVIIVAAAALAAVGCFYFAWLSDEDEEPQ